MKYSELQKILKRNNATKKVMKQIAQYLDDDKEALESNLQWVKDDEVKQWVEEMIEDGVGCWEDYELPEDVDWALITEALRESYATELAAMDDDDFPLCACCE